MSIRQGKISHISECNLTIEKCEDSIKATVRRLKSQILKGASPEKAVRNGYEKTCDCKYYEQDDSYSTESPNLSK